ncbi:MAG TPA: helix-turn-helix transcriptional regulator [Mycobacteriales bacterium]|nr:helix-turn-helix transcriptional regulator [Mycobacteriales bacterium]
MSGEHIGGRIASRRKLRGLTQQQLADRAHVSVSLLRKVEQGVKPASAALVASVAKILHADRVDLTGQPYRTGNRVHDAVHDLVPDVRRELVAYRMAPVDDQPVPSLAQLTVAVAGVSARRHQVNLSGLGAQLPIVLADLRAASFTHQGTERERVMGLWAETWYAARQFLWKLGYDDLSSRVADRYEWTAAQSADPLAMALSNVFQAGELDGAGDWRGARVVMADALAGLPPPGRPEELSVHGFLHLMSAYMAAHAGDEPDVWAHHAEAERLAQRLGADLDHYRLAFGPTNVAIWACALGVELMDGGRALERARDVHLTPHTPPERAGHYYVDLARAHLLRGDRRAALEGLLRARTIAPQQTRYSPMARDTVHALATAERRSTDSLRGLACWMGLAG